MLLIKDFMGKFLQTKCLTLCHNCLCHWRWSSMSRTKFKVKTKQLCNIHSSSSFNWVTCPNRKGSCKILEITTYCFTFRDLCALQHSKLNEGNSNIQFHINCYRHCNLKKKFKVNLSPAKISTTVEFCSGVSCLTESYSGADLQFHYRRTLLVARSHRFHRMLNRKEQLHM